MGEKSLTTIIMNQTRSAMRTLFKLLAVMLLVKRAASADNFNVFLEKARKAFMNLKRERRSTITQWASVKAEFSRPRANAVSEMKVTKESVTLLEGQLQEAQKSILD